MSRPIKPRTTKSYVRDVETLGRLRMAIVADPKLPGVKIRAAVSEIDRVIERLLEFARAFEREVGTNGTDG